MKFVRHFEMFYDILELSENKKKYKKKLLQKECCLNICRKSCQQTDFTNFIFNKFVLKGVLRFGDIITK